MSGWCEIEACEPFAALEAAIAEVLGPDAARAYRNGPWGFSDAQHLKDEMSGAGFFNVEFRRDEVTVVFEDVVHLIRTLGAVPVGAKVQALDADGLPVSTGGEPTLTSDVDGSPHSLQDSRRHDVHTEVMTRTLAHPRGLPLTRRPVDDESVAAGLRCFRSSFRITDLLLDAVAGMMHLAVGEESS